MKTLMKDQHGNVLRLCREYEDLNGQQRIAVYLEDGPAGKRWLMEDESILTIDIVERTHFKNYNGKLYKYGTHYWDPWSAAKNIKDSWVVEQDGE